MNTHYLTQLPEEWEGIARIFAALGDGTRQKMLLLFEAGETISLKTLVDILPLSRSAVVHHISVLEQAGLLIAARHGREVGYTLHTAPLMDGLENVLDYAKNLEATAKAEGLTAPCTDAPARTSGRPPARPPARPPTRSPAQPDARPRPQSGSPAEPKSGAPGYDPRSAPGSAPVNTGQQGESSPPTPLFVPLSAQELAHD